MDLRVLLADADQPLLEQYIRGLEQSGLSVAWATSALDCVARLREFRPDVLVLDPALPWGRGEGVLELMQSEQDLPLVPIIVLSAVPEPVGLHRVGSIEVAEYLEKPMAPHEVIAAIRRVCARSKTH